MTAFSTSHSVQPNQQNIQHFQHKGRLSSLSLSPSGKSMSICTVFLYHDVTLDGWSCDIDGLIYSQRQAFRKIFPNSIYKNGEATLTVTPREEPAFKGHQSHPPLHIVTAYLKQIAQAGYKVEGTDSSSDENGYRKTTLWTLQCIN